ncbi:gliding motility-associated C-terminal domain-containing protein [Winogradskyella sp. UBA3174]|uniref:T9SS type B sorting domain-containing protein n=1 Tax=Winogradskyella sp. UBA3174 TaxID=1947785 RepID=UPI0025F47B0D|nr:gliding motility-associated C-terminal domain-containing protein [Winogradskyella sp. UBA3174]|tara:strand:- start:20378 stop:20596 length:219 start_codon:yes stop_codon:yes gene_type:complete
MACVKDYLQNRLKIYNRYGVKIFEASNYNNTWNGRANMGILKQDKVMPLGTYYYILKINGLDSIIGWLYINC